MGTNPGYASGRFSVRSGWARHIVHLLLACLVAGGMAAVTAWAVVQEKKAVSFLFRDLEGRPVRLDDYRGKWVLVNFWAYWCPLCRIGVPTLNELNRRDDLVVIGVSLDYGDSDAKVREAIDQHGLNYQAQVAGGSRRDPNSPHRQVGPVDFFPTSYLYDPTGEIVMYIPGQIRKGQLLAFMDKWGDKKPGTAPRPTYAMDLVKFESALTQRYGAAGADAFRKWRALREELATEADENKLARVNDFFNRHVRHMDDRQAWGRPDYWATPSETLGAGRGDSEDIAMAKYFTLLSLDIPVERMRLVYTRLRDEARAKSDPVHMVLAYYPTPEQDPLVLDDHYRQIRPASQRSELRPVFSFNSQHVWHLETEASGQPAVSTYNQPAWQRTLQRARAEGFE